MKNSSDQSKPCTPLKPGRYWYDTFELPTGVSAELVLMHDGSAGVRFCFTSTVQAEQLAGQAAAFASLLGNGVRAARRFGEPEPPEVGE